jgi:hypothetical protein
MLFLIMNLIQHLLKVKEYDHLQVKEYVVLWAGAEGLPDSVHVAGDI